MSESSILSSELLALTEQVGELRIAVNELLRRVEMLEAVQAAPLIGEWLGVGIRTIPEVPYETTSTQRGDCR